MREIILESWNRREHFEFFRRLDLPFYNVCFDLDISGLQPLVRTQRLSLNHTLIHLAIQAAHQIENFRYRIRQGKVFLHDRLHPSFTHLPAGAELFKMVTMDFQDDLFAFDRAAKAACREQTAYFPLDTLQGRDDFIYFSSLPWISFTGLDHTLNLQKDDAVPRISWGKYHQESDKLLLPFNLQVNHQVIDGYHVGLFKEKLDQAIKTLEETHRG